MTTSLSPYTRVLRALRRERVDRPPVCAFQTAINRTMMEWAGENFATALESPERCARLASAPVEVYGIENVKVPFDMTVEPGLFGAGIDLGGPEVLPQVSRHPFDSAEDFAIPKGWQDKGRAPFLRRTIELLKDQSDGEVPICALCDGPFSLANMLFGFNHLLIWLSEDRPSYERAMDGVTEFCIAYCAMLRDAGADLVQFGEAAASGDLISARQYADSVAPWHRRLAESVSLPTVMHICGNISGHFAALAETGLHSISFDQKADPALAVKHCAGKMALVGFVPIPILNGGAPEDVARSARESLAAGVHILHAGCAWPPTVPDANARALVGAVSRK